MALEVTIISAEELTINRRHVSTRKSPFVAVQTDSSHSLATTKPDPAGGSYPHWNQRLSVNSPSSSLKVEVRYSGDRLIGAATIPARDFTGAHLPVDYLHFLSYRLRDRNGEPNGIINISVRTVGMTGGAATSGSRPWM